MQWLGMRVFAEYITLLLGCCFFFLMSLNSLVFLFTFTNTVDGNVYFVPGVEKRLKMFSFEFECAARNSSVLFSLDVPHSDLAFLHL